MAAAGGRVGTIVQGSIDRLKDAPQIPIDIIIPESKDAKTVTDEFVVTLSITFGFDIKIVLAAVDLDDEPMLHADKINNKSLARRLPAEVISVLAP